mmetsp:Transcript_41212/g.93187  ORF Transcript_41212/g.93187 Transcript_41212/m.93187 type:complete len:211 (+) Transcript_41212:136-768(+)
MEPIPTVPLFQILCSCLSDPLSSRAGERQELFPVLRRSAVFGKLSVAGKCLDQRPDDSAWAMGFNSWPAENNVSGNSLGLWSCHPMHLPEHTALHVRNTGSRGGDPSMLQRPFIPGGPAPLRYVNVLLRQPRVPRFSAGSGPGASVGGAFARPGWRPTGAGQGVSGCWCLLQPGPCGSNLSRRAHAGTLLGENIRQRASDGRRREGIPGE